MNEILLFLQALLLIAGWLLFLRAQQELRAQAAKQSLVGEADGLRRSVEALIQRLVTEAERVDSQLKKTIQEARRASESTPLAAEEPPSAAIQEGRYSHVYALADEGVPPGQIARQVGMLPGEVELVLSLRPVAVYAHRMEGD